MPQRFFRRRRIFLCQGAQNPVGTARRHGRQAGQTRLVRRHPSGRLSLGLPAWHHTGQPGPGLAWRTGRGARAAPGAGIFFHLQPGPSDLAFLCHRLQPHHLAARRFRRAYSQNYLHTEGGSHRSSAGPAHARRVCALPAAGHCHERHLELFSAHGFHAAGRGRRPRLFPGGTAHADSRFQQAGQSGQGRRPDA